VGGAADAQLLQGLLHCRGCAHPLPAAEGEKSALVTIIWAHNGQGCHLLLLVQLLPLLLLWLRLWAILGLW
jgi:hypothetical protein